MDSFNSNKFKNQCMKTTLTLFAFVLINTLIAQQPIGKPQTITATKTTGCVSGNCTDGWGKWQFDNGYYDGFWANGMRNGYGLYKWDVQGTYIGFWVNNNMEGYGSYESEKGVIMKGMYSNGQLNGFGEVYNENLEWVSGFYKDGNIQDKYDFIDNYLDYGCIAGDCLNKYGRYRWQNDDEFTGFFLYGNPHLGIYTFSNKNNYQGMFNVSGQFHGQGRFFYSEGGYYGGEFINGELYGKGYYHNNEYKTQIGIWENGKLVKSL